MEHNWEGVGSRQVLQLEYSVEKFFFFWTSVVFYIFCPNYSPTSSIICCRQLFVVIYQHFHPKHLAAHYIYTYMITISIIVNRPYPSVCVPHPSHGQWPLQSPSPTFAYGSFTSMKMARFHCASKQSNRTACYCSAGDHVDQVTFLPLRCSMASSTLSSTSAMASTATHCWLAAPRSNAVENWQSVVLMMVSPITSRSSGVKDASRWALTIHQRCIVSPQVTTVWTWRRSST